MTNPWAAAAQQAAAAAARVPPPTVAGIAANVDRCTEHPGVKWYGDMPCFVCDPEAWNDAPWLQRQGPEPDGDGVAVLMQEMVDSGHWPPNN